MVTAAQLGGARAQLGWTQGGLARASQISRATIADFETGRRAPLRRTLRDIVEALSAGVVCGDQRSGRGLQPDAMTAPSPQRRPRRVPPAAA